MYQEDPKHAIDLMDDEANIWGIHSSPLTFAHENFMYEIVAHTCSQKYINIQWYNDLAPDLVPFFKVHVPKKHKKEVKFIPMPTQIFMYLFNIFFIYLVTFLGCQKEAEKFLHCSTYEIRV